MKRPTHPDGIFEFAAGILDESRARDIEAHLSECSDCKLLVASLSAMRGVFADSKLAESHPPVVDLADFFYSGRKGRFATVAAHVAVCADCAQELAQYARAEAAASSYKVSRRSREQVPAAAWEMIGDWEDSSLAKPKEDSSIASEELLDMLSALFQSQSERPFVREEVVDESGLEAVTVIDRTGTVRTVELFQRVAGGLKHARESYKYDDKPVHALLEFGEGRRLVVTDKVRGDRIELKSHTYPTKDLVDAAYFIVED